MSTDRQQIQRAAREDGWQALTRKSIDQFEKEAVRISVVWEPDGALRQGHWTRTDGFHVTADQTRDPAKVKGWLTEEPQTVAVRSEPVAPPTLDEVAAMFDRAAVGAGVAFEYAQSVGDGEGMDRIARSVRLYVDAAQACAARDAGVAADRFRARLHALRTDADDDGDHAFDLGR